MNPRDKFISALERKPITGRVPHFELVFFLTMEAFGKVHPSHRNYYQWDQMGERERNLHRNDIADIQIAIAEKYEHSAIYLCTVSNNPYALRYDVDECTRMIDLLREKSGDKYCIMLPGDATFSIPNGSDMLGFSYRISDDPSGLHRQAAAMVDQALEEAQKYRQHGGADGFIMAADYCLNSGPFLSPGQFGEFVTPYLARLIEGYRQLGFYTVKHTDGNIMPILDQLVEANPHALHSIDPQAGVDIAEVKRICGKKICLIGNVNCGLLQNGTDNEVIENVRYALKNGMPGGGYIFSTSNCIYSGMALSRYELMLDVWRREGVY